MLYRVEINDEIVDTLMVPDTIMYNLTGDQVADLCEYLTGLGYEWCEVAYVWEQRAKVAA
jgi:hypothetical protein